MIVIPSSELGDSTRTIVLNQQSYDLRLKWNTREKAWYMWLGLSGVTPSFKTKVVNGINLIKQVQHLDGIPSGGIFTVDTVAKYGRVGRDDFGIFKRHALVYLTQEEIDNGV